MLSHKKIIIQNLLTVNLSKSEAEAEFYFLLEALTGLKKKDFLLNPKLKLDKETEEKLVSLVKRRVEEKIPVQYLVNKAYFMSLAFYVDENVLIPRPETEILVQKAVELAKNFENPKILDIGTGSGCIPCALAKFISTAEVTTCDISENAINVAKKMLKNLMSLKK